MDSSLVLRYAYEYSDKPLDTFSIVFENAKFSEKKWIDISADKCSANQHQYYFSANDFNDLFEKATWHLDEPLNHPNSIGIMKICEEARNYVTVLLSGEGADELLGGYGRYSRLLWSYKHPLLDSGIDILKHRYKKGKGSSFRDSAIASSMYVKSDYINNILPGLDYHQGIRNRELLWDSVPGSGMKKFLNYELRTYLVDILNRQDKMSMAFSVETRTPFLNYELIDYVRKHDVSSYVKPSLRHTIYNTKIPLKLLAVKEYGSEFAYRSKSGFPMPLREYFGEKHFIERVEDRIMPFLRDQGIINMNYFENLWRKRDQLSDNELEETLWVGIAFGEWGVQFLKC